MSHAYLIGFILEYSVFIAFVQFSDVCVVYMVCVCCVVKCRVCLLLLLFPLAKHVMIRISPLPMCVGPKHREARFLHCLLLK